MFQNRVSKIFQYIARYILAIGRFVTFATIFLTAVNGVFGTGFLYRTFTQSKVFFNQQQLIVDSITLSRCTVENHGQKNAENIIIEVTTEDQALINEIKISGAERNWTILGGGEGENFVIVKLERLVSSNPIMVTIATDSIIPFACQVNSAEGPASPDSQEINNFPFSLQWGDITILILVNIFSAIFIFRRFGDNRLSLTAQSQNENEDINESKT